VGSKPSGQAIWELEAASARRARVTCLVVAPDSHGGLSLPPRYDAAARRRYGTGSALVNPAASGPLAHGSPLTVGWREWLAFPDLGIAHIKAKIDTGARTSALHAFFVEPYREGGARMVRFGVHPLQRRDDVARECRAAMVDYRWVSDSGGHREQRYVILTTLVLGALSWPVELTLTNRDDMRFRILLGRTAMRGRLLVDPAASYLVGHRPRRTSKGSPP